MVGVGELQGGAPNVTGSPQPTVVPLMSQGLPNRRHSHPLNTNSKNIGPLLAEGVTFGCKQLTGGPFFYRGNFCLTDRLTGTKFALDLILTPVAGGSTGSMGVTPP